jgi:hypothetical protein
MFIRRFNFFVSILFFVLLASMSALATDTGNGDDIIKSQEQGENCFKQARTLLSSLGVTVPRNILLKVRSKDEVQVQYISTGGRAILVGGYYQPYDPETIWIIINQPRDKTIGDMAHELAHAWQSTNCPLQDRTLVEGFAMWCEYKVLVGMGHKRYAEHLAQSPDPDYGEGLRLFLKVEAKRGASGVIEFAKKNTKVPKDI